MNKKIAVVLLNLGGPDDQSAVQNFLFNLFYDKAIISLPNPFRFFLAKFISSKRAPIAKHIYQQIGGGSPILAETKKQADALEKKLNENSVDKYKLFISMRYWHPFSSEALSEVKKYHPDEVILLPLYPQFSASTTWSSIEDWKKNAEKLKINYPIKTICCYPSNEKFIAAHVALIEKSKVKIPDQSKVRILFSAHGLPKKNIVAGDPYQHQIEKTVEQIVKKLSIKNLDFVICYQSKVGRLQWLGASTDE